MYLYAEIYIKLVVDMYNQTGRRWGSQDKNTLTRALGQRREWVSIHFFFDNCVNTYWMGREHNKPLQNSSFFKINRYFLMIPSDVKYAHLYQCLIS
jgi:hypothetical protein